MATSISHTHLSISSITSNIHLHVAILGILLLLDVVVLLLDVLTVLLGSPFLLVLSVENHSIVVHCTIQTKLDTW